MKKIKKILKAEFINGQTEFDWWFLIAGILTQAIAIIYACVNPDGMSNSQIFWTAVSGLTGIISVVLCAQGKISFYVFGYIQLFTYVFAVAIPERLWGEVGENIFYFITMIIGTILWLKQYHNHENGALAVKSKKLTKVGWIISILTFVISTIMLALVLQNTSDPLPWFDSVTTTAPFIAQIFLMLGYREQWAFWIIEDILSFGMFIVLFNPVMIVQYAFWTVNCIYGWIKWTRENRGQYEKN